MMSQQVQPQAPFKDYYAALQLRLGASSSDVHEAYRGLVRQYSAGTDKAAKTRLAELNEAYHVLASPAFRREYDQLWIADAARPAPILDEGEEDVASASRPPPLAVMAKQQPRARPREPQKLARRWLEGRRFLLVLTLVASFWIIVGVALVVRLA